MARKKEPEVFFLRGYMRSGTNWLGRVVNLHPDINCQGEFHLQQFGQGKSKVDRSTSCIITGGNKNMLDAEFEKFIKTLVRNHCGREHKLVGDRTPTGISALVVPNSKYLLIQRDGRDVITSWFKHILKTVSKNKGRLKRYRKFSEYPEMLNKLKKVRNKPNYFEVNKKELMDCEGYFRFIASQWNTRIINDNKMSEVAKVRNLDILHISYEKMHANPEEERAKIYEFLGLDPKLAAPLDVHTLPGFAKKIPKGQHRGIVANWYNYFDETMAEWFDSEASEALKILGLESTEKMLQKSLVETK